MKIAFTGGHFSPAIAVIDCLPKDTEILFIGRKYQYEGDTSPSFEYREITSRRIPFVSLQTGRLQRTFTLHTIPSICRIPFGLWRALQILRAFRPDLVVTFGGYIGFPVSVACFILRIPLVIHEQTLGAGMTNRFASIFATKICVSYESSRQYFPKDKTILTGLPIRKELMLAGRDKNIKHPLIYVTGGSGGSRMINDLIMSCLKELLSLAYVIHQTGGTRLNNLKKNERYRAQNFFSAKEVATILSSCDLVIGRAGINTVSEIILFEKPALLIPLPHGQRGEQMQNAQFLKSIGLGEVLLQKEANKQRFISEVEKMLLYRDSYYLHNKELKDNFKQAAAKMAQVIVDVANKTTKQKT
jgi:UDP-N-acetylglucosamine--N-acetylmuramyl-(pentapeptide) pyrophosphoryl-undecaprenol N-acetylglucosamine transferase